MNEAHEIGNKTFSTVLRVIEDKINQKLVQKAVSQKKISRPILQEVRQGTEWEVYEIVFSVWEEISKVMEY